MPLALVSYLLLINCYVYKLDGNDESLSILGVNCRAQKVCGGATGNR